MHITLLKLGVINFSGILGLVTLLMCPIPEKAFVFIEANYKKAQ